MLTCLWATAFAANDAENSDIVEKDGIFYQLSQDSSDPSEYTVNVVGWLDEMTELDIPDEVELEFPETQDEKLSRGYGDGPEPGHGTTRRYTIITFFTRGYNLVPHKTDNITKILLGSNIRINGTFSEYNKLKTLTLPSKVEEIPDSMFYGCSSLTDIIIPGTVHTIGAGAFCDCINLKNVTFEPNNYYAGVIIYPDAFQRCSALTKIELPDSNLYTGSFDSCENLTYVSCGDNSQIVGNPFTRCAKLTDFKFNNSSYDIRDGLICNKELGMLLAAYPSTIGKVAIPSYITKIGDYAFAYCTNLKNVQLSHFIESIGYNAFACSGIEEVNTQDMYKFGEDDYSYRFQNCEKLAKLRLGANFNQLVARDFLGCDNLTEITVDSDNEKYELKDGLLYSGTYLVLCPPGLSSVTLSESTTSTAQYAFAGNEKLTTLTLPQSIESLADYTFMNCSGLTSLVIPDKVRGIFRGTFCFCSNLESLTLGKSVNSFRDWAFDGCDRLVDLYVLNPEPPEAYFEREEDYIFTEFMLENTTVHVPEGSLDKYRASSLWSRFKKIQGISSALNEISNGDGADLSVVEVYSVSGVKVAESTENLPAGIYILRKGSNTTKIVI